MDKSSGEIGKNHMIEASETNKEDKKRFSIDDVVTSQNEVTGTEIREIRSGTKNVDESLDKIQITPEDVDKMFDKSSVFAKTQELASESGTYKTGDGRTVHVSSQRSGAPIFELRSKDEDINKTFEQPLSESELNEALGNNNTQETKLMETQEMEMQKSINKKDMETAETETTNENSNREVSV